MSIDVEQEEKLHEQKKINTRALVMAKRCCVQMYVADTSVYIFCVPRISSSLLLPLYLKIIKLDTL